MSSTDVQVRSTAFAVTITATTRVAADPARVWQVLTDTAAYPDWNPFVRRLEGDLVEGNRLTVDLQPGDKATTLRPTVVAVVPGRSFTWLGHVGFRGVLDGRHTFTVEPDGSGSRLVQHEVLSGVLTPLFRKMLTTDTPAAFTASNDALAARATGASEPARDHA
jgi:hypothetical protein